jgi:hypothetical protein
MSTNFSTADTPFPALLITQESSFGDLECTNAMRDWSRWRTIWIPPPPTIDNMTSRIIPVAIRQPRAGKPALLRILTRYSR